MTVSSGAVQLDLVANSKSFEAQAEAAAARVKNSWNKLAGVMGGTLAFTGLAAFSKSCIEAASAAQQTANRVSTVFPTMSESVNAFASKAITQMGMTAGSAKNLTVRFGQMAQGLGLSEQQALGMSEQMTRLAGDMAAFYGITSDEARSTLQGVFTGLTRGFKQYGIVMSEDNLQAHALSMGIQQSVSSMNQAELAALRLSYAQAQMANVQGYAQRNTQTWAGQTNMLANQFAVLRSTLGQGMMAVLLPLVKGLNAVMAAAIRAAQGFNALVEAVTGKKLSASIGGAAGAAADLGETVGDTAGSTGGLANAQKEAAKAAKAQDKAQRALNRTLAGFDKINKLSSNKMGASVNPSSGGVGGGGSGGVGDVGGGVGGFSFDDMFGTEAEEKASKAIELPERLKKSLQRFGKYFGEFIEVVKKGLGWVFDNILRPLGKWLMEEVSPRVIDIITEAVRILTSVLKALAPVGEFIWEHFFKPLAGLAGDVIIFMLDGIAGALKAIADFAEKHPKAFQTIVVGLTSLFALHKGAGVFRKAISSIMAGNGLKGLLSGGGKLSKMISKFSKTKIGSKLTSLFKLFAKNPILIALTAIVLALGYLYKNWDKIKNTKIGQSIQKLMDKLKGLSEKLQPVMDKFNELKDKVLDKLSEKAGQLWEKVEPAIESFIDGFGDVLVSVLSTAIDWLGKIVDWLGKAVDWLGENLPKAAEKAKEIIGKFLEVWNGIKDKAVELASSVKEKVKGALETLKEKWNSIKDKAAELATSVKEKAKGALATLKEKWEGIKSKAAELATSVKEKVKGALNSLKEKWGEIKTKAATLTAQAKTKAKQTFNYLKKAWGDVKNKTAELVAKAKDKLGSTWKNIKDAWRNFKDKTASLVAKAKDKVSDIKSWWTSRANEWKEKTVDYAIKMAQTIDAIKKWYKERGDQWIEKSVLFKILPDPLASKIKEWWDARSSKWNKKDVSYTVSAGTKSGTISSWWNDRAKRWKGLGRNFTINAGATSVGSVSRAWSNRANKWKNKTATFTIRYAAGNKIGSALGSQVNRALHNLGVPGYAQGAFVRRNTPHLAVIGDNRTEGEIVSPESKFQTMLNAAVAAGGGAGGVQMIAVLEQILTAIQSQNNGIYLDSKPITRAVVNNINAQTQATGRSPILI